MAAVEAREDRPTSTRIPDALIDELDALAERIEFDSEVVALIGPSRGVSRSAVLRLALIEGVKVLNVKYPPKRRRKARSR